MARTRAIRFSDSEEKQIEEFLTNNSFLDFSSMARLAILEFLRNPKITVRPVEQQGLDKGRSIRSDNVRQKQ
jgi:hypothetical protein